MSTLKNPRWTALPDSVQERLLEKYWDLNVQHDWPDETIAEFKAKALALGVEVDDVYWSGFWSQGDGACFTGRITDWSKFLAAVKPDIDPAVGGWVGDNSTTMYIKTRGSYCHSGTMHTEFDFQDLEQPPDLEDLQLSLWKVLTKNGDILYEMESDILAYLRGLADGLYQELEKEYEGLTSDEAVADALLANHEDLNSLVDDHEFVW